MIQPQLHIANADGKVLRVEGPARGFYIRPGIPESWGVAGTRRPGGYPITVRLYPSGEQIPVYGPGRHYFGRREFEGLEILDASEGDVFLVCLLEHEADRYELSTFPTPVRAPLQLNGEVNTAAPASASDGWEVLVGQIGWVFSFSGDLTKTAQLYERTIPVTGGTGSWVSGGTDNLWLPSATTVLFAEAKAAGGRIALQASGSGLIVTVDRVMGIV